MSALKSEIRHSLHLSYKRKICADFHALENHALPRAAEKRFQADKMDIGKKRRKRITGVDIAESEKTAYHSFQTRCRTWFRSRSCLYHLRPSRYSTENFGLARLSVVLETDIERLRIDHRGRPLQAAERCAGLEHKFPVSQIRE